MKRRFLALAASVALVLGSRAEPARADVALTRIAETGLSANAPAINNNGTVVFLAFDWETLTGGLYVWDGVQSMPVLVVDFSNYPFYPPDTIIPEPASINDDGVIAFHGFRFTADGNFISGVYTIDAGGITVIDELSPFTNVRHARPLINSAGQVAFVRFEPSSFLNPEPFSGIYLASGGQLTTIAESSGSFSNLGWASGTSISLNDAGTVAFAANVPGGWGIFTGDGGPLTTIALSSNYARLGVLPSINNAGDVVFEATPVGGLPSILRWHEGVTSTVVDTSGPYSGFFRPVLNDAGRVAFFAELRAGGYGIFTGPDPDADAIVRRGTPLDGSTVRSIDYFEGGFNDAGQLAFDAYLDDGRDVIVRADPVNAAPVGPGQTAGIGFWNNKNGQGLIKALNGGGTSTRLGDWLATSFPGMYGAQAGASNLAGKTNDYVAAFYQGRFALRGDRLDVQVLATALAVYVTDATLNDTGLGTRFGFDISSPGVGGATFNVGAGGTAFGVADQTTMTVLNLLRALDARAVGGVLYNGNPTLRALANTVFEAINRVGGI